MDRATTRDPGSIGGKNTQTVHIRFNTDIDAHCERARATGAEILVEPETQFYGDRTYRCRDLEGHIWTVAQTVANGQPASRPRAVSGLKIDRMEYDAPFAGIDRTRLPRWPTCNDGAPWIC